ncbi:MAG: cytochrome B [Comamonadaceae bacterium]|nr:MAG: cytochrome B [Comamonadaceae bacterium]
MAYRVRVWDLPTRIFHWVLAACVIGLVVTAKAGAMLWHERLGSAVLALLLFRIVWGLVGGHWSRFRTFVYAPASVVAYLRGRAHPDHLIGHTPLGAASVFAMLLVLAAQVGTGLVSDDEISFTGPLNRFISTDAGLAATTYHRSIGQWLVIGLVVLHIAAIAWYAWRKRQNLVRPMIAGDKEVGEEARSARDDLATRVLAAVLLAACGAATWWIVGLGNG